MPHSALAAIPPPTFPDLRTALVRAVALGGNDTGVSGDDERQLTPTALLAGAVPRLVELGVYAQLVQVHVPDVDPGSPMMRAVLQALRGSAAGALRLTHRCLEVHARNVGYAPAVWVENAVEAAFLALEAARSNDDGSPSPLGQARAAARHVSEALIACEQSRMDVPSALGPALACVLPLFVLASELLDADSDALRLFGDL